jgi:hypothetical protein
MYHTTYYVNTGKYPKQYQVNFIHWKKMKQKMIRKHKFRKDILIQISQIACITLLLGVYNTQGMYLCYPTHIFIIPCNVSTKCFIRLYHCIQLQYPMVHMGKRLHLSVTSEQMIFH